MSEPISEVDFCKSSLAYSSALLELVSQAAETAGNTGMQHGLYMASVMVREMAATLEQNMERFGSTNELAEFWTSRAVEFDRCVRETELSA